MILIFSAYHSPRLNYVLSEVLKRRLGLSFQVTTDLDLFNASPLPKINYSAENTGAGIRIIPQGLLSQTGMDTAEPHVVSSERWRFIFWPDGNGQIPFDLFSAVFYQLARCEEYTLGDKDEYGRFPASRSIASKYGFLDLPLVEVWCAELRSILERQYPEIKITLPEFKMLSTVDIDFAYLYKGLRTGRWLGKMIRAILQLRFYDVITQVLVRFGRRKDPYDTYDEIFSASKGEVAFFVLMSDLGGHDKNIPPMRAELRTLLTRLSHQSRFIGLHPSWHSNELEGLLENEKSRLEELLGREVVQSRQHFLRMNLPATYRALAAAGIREDYTMMYAERPGFRAGTCVPFRFYDIELEMESELVIFSTCLMDVTLNHYLKLNTTAAINVAENLMGITQEYSGYFITLWHNNSLSDRAGWYGWRKVYKSCFKPE